MAQVSASMRSTGQRRSDQGKVWRDISEKSSRFRVASETSAMSDIYAHEGDRLEDYVRFYSVLEGQCGAVFAIGRRMVGLELFDAEETLRKLFPKLLRSYGLDALDHARSEPCRKEMQCTPVEVDTFLKKRERRQSGGISSRGRRFGYPAFRSQYNRCRTGCRRSHHSPERFFDRQLKRSCFAERRTQDLSYHMLRGFVQRIMQQNIASEGGRLWNC